MDWIDSNTYFGSWPKRRLDVPADALVALLREAGTSRAMTLSLVAPLLDAREGTKTTLDECLAHRELIPFGCVSPRDYTGGEEVRELATLGCAAVRLTNALSGWPVDYAPLEVVLAECAGASLPAFLDVTGPGQITQIERLASKTGATIVLCGGGYATLSEAMVCLARTRNLFFETSKLNTPDGVKLLCDEAGADHVMFGSGAPFHYATSARRVAEHAGLTDDQVSWVASRTLRSLLREEFRT